MSVILHNIVPHEMTTAGKLSTSNGYELKQTFRTAIRRPVRLNHSADNYEAHSWRTRHALWLAHGDLAIDVVVLVITGSSVWSVPTRQLRCNRPMCIKQSAKPSFAKFSERQVIQGGMSKLVRRPWTITMCLLCVADHEI